MKTKKPTARISLDAYVSKAKPRRSIRCETCRSCDPEMLDDIRRLAELRKKGEISLPIPQIFEEFLVPNGFKGTIGTLRNHIRSCLKIRLAG